MKKFIFLLLLITISRVTYTQNVGIGTNNPNRAKLVLNGSVGNTTAIFGGETTGISLQSNFPTIGFNEYYNNGHRYIAAGHGAHQFFDPALGYMAFDIFPPGVANGTATGSKRVMILTSTGDMVVGDGNGRLAINTDPAQDGAHNAALQIRQSVESNNAGITMSDMFNVRTWKISSRNINDGVLALGLNSYDVGYFNASGDYISTSDRRLKNNIQQLPSVLTKLMQLNPVQYSMKYNNASGHTSIGFIAQDVKEIFPELVHIMNDAGNNGYTDLHAVSYSGFAVLAVKAIQEQQKVIEGLEERIVALEKKLLIK